MQMVKINKQNNKIMKRFQELLSNDIQNQYGLQYKPIKDLYASSRLKNCRDNDVINLDTVQIYLKSNKKSIKIVVEKRSKMQNLRQKIQLRMFIPYEDQIIYLNGREINAYSSITFNPQQILHISNRKEIVHENQILKINLKISTPSDTMMNNKILSVKMKGNDYVKSLQNLISQMTTLNNPQNSFQFNFLQSGRILIKNQSFTNNLLTNNCDIVCLLSQNQVETKFVNDFQDIIQEINCNQPINQNLTRNRGKIHQQINESQNDSQSLKFKKDLINANRFIVNKEKKNIYTRIQRKSQGNENAKANMPKRQNGSESISFNSTGFKKKQHYDEDYDSETSHLIRKIVVNKSRDVLEKMYSETCLLKEEVSNEDEKKSVVSSSSSSEQNKKQYIPIRQQKQYRPCPLIPQRKMAQSEKLKINFELQKLFGQEPKANILSNTQSQNISSELIHQNNSENMKSRQVVRNSSMRNSISSKESMLKMLNDRKPNRYDEEKMYEGE